MNRQKPTKPNKAFFLYQKLLKQYGSPGRWPWFNKDKPHTKEEIVIGAILTQNTNWNNVQKAIENLRKVKVTTIRGIYELGNKELELLKGYIRPCGFYNQKSERLFLLCKYIIERYKNLKNFSKLPIRKMHSKLLSLKGIGNETADTIMLYALNKPIFVVDGYTKRFVKIHKLTKNLNYESMQKYFMQSLQKNIHLYQDYHAFIVQWGKNHNKKDLK